jgi:hypothetical protein
VRQKQSGVSQTRDTIHVIHVVYRFLNFLYTFWICTGLKSPTVCTTEV